MAPNLLTTPWIVNTIPMEVFDTEHYADDSITEAKIANDAIGAAELKSVSTLLIKNAAGGHLENIVWCWCINIVNGSN